MKKNEHSSCLLKGKTVRFGVFKRQWHETVDNVFSLYESNIQI